jgi:hypothetical protein
VPSGKGLEEVYTLQPTPCSKLQNSELQGSEIQNSTIGSLAYTQVIMSDIGVEEEVIVIDIENDITDNSNINAATTIPARVIPIMPASINVSRNKTRFDTNRVLFI